MNHLEKLCVRFSLYDRRTNLRQDYFTLDGLSITSSYLFVCLYEIPLMMAYDILVWEFAILGSRKYAYM